MPFRRSTLTQRLAAVLTPFLLFSLFGPMEDAQARPAPVVAGYVWQELTGKPGWDARAGLQVVELDGRLFLMGGRTPLAPDVDARPGASRIWSDVWTSDDDGRTWSRLLESDGPGHWTARAYFQAVVHRGRIVVLGGQNFDPDPGGDGQTSGSEFFNDVWSSADGIRWDLETAAAPWRGRAGLSAVSFGPHIYVMAGSINDDPAIVGGPPQREYLNDVWRSEDGSEWELVTESAPWARRAGAPVVVKDDAMYLLGGEEGFVCGFGSRCPPYFRDVWRSVNGSDWELVTASAPWAARPGHQVVVADDVLMLFGGFGLNPDPFQPFLPSNPMDVWVSGDGARWQRLDGPPWNATSPEGIKYDFDALVVDGADGRDRVLTFGGDRETFDFSDPTNYVKVDDDVWELAPASEGSTPPVFQSDRVTLDLTRGGSTYSVSATVTDGDVALEADVAGVKTLTGSARLPDGTSVSFDVERFLWLPVHFGTIDVSVPETGLRVTFPVLSGNVDVAGATASGSQTWLFSPGPLRFERVSLDWSVVDSGQPPAGP